MLTSLKGARPSPALVIAVIALFVSLGGAGYAAVTITGKNVKNSSLTGSDVKNSSLTGKDVRNSSLTGSDIKNSSLAGRDVKNNSLTGSDVLESSLGTVPSAGSANTAAVAGRAGSAASVDKLKTVGSYKKVGPSASDADPNVARAAATQVPLLSFGAFSFYGKCFTDTAGNLYAEYYIKTSQNGSIFDSENDTAYGGPFLDTGTPETDRQLELLTQSADTASINHTHPQVLALAPDGTGIAMRPVLAAKNGTLPGGNGVYGPGNVCLFGGYLVG